MRTTVLYTSKKRRKETEKEEPRGRSQEEGILFLAAFSAIDLLAIGTYFSSPFSNPKTTSSTW